MLTLIHSPYDHSPYDPLHRFWIKYSDINILRIDRHHHSKSNLFFIDFLIRLVSNQLFNFLFPIQRPPKNFRSKLRMKVNL